MTAAELRRKAERAMERTKRTREPMQVNDIPFNMGVASAMDAVLALIPKEGVFVTESALAEALRESHRTGGAHGNCTWSSDHQHQSAHILARLQDDAVRRCVECGEPWPCSAVQFGRDKKTPHRLGVSR